MTPDRAPSVLAAATTARARGDLPAIPDDPTWTVEVAGAEPALEWMHDSWLAMVDGVIGTQGSPLAVYPPARREVMVGGVYSGIGPATDALRVPDWTRLAGQLRPEEPIRRVLDLRTGFVHHEATSTLGGYRAVTFASRTMPGLGVLRAQGGGARSPADGPLAAVRGRVPKAGRTAAPRRGRRDDRPTIAEVSAERGGVVVAARQSASGSGSTRRLDRLSAYRAGSRRRPTVRAALGMLRKAERLGIESLIGRQRAAWARRWAEMGIMVEGDPELQRAIAFSLYHLDASIANQSEAPLGPRGLTGPSYKSHVFWDSECYVLPFFAATRPAAARAMLTYRARRIEPARQAAKEAGFAGAWFPWESAADGRDVTPTWVHGDDAVPIRVWTGERELHVVSDIAWAVDHYVAWSGDTRFAATMACGSSSRALVSGRRGSSATRTGARTSAASSDPTSTTSSSTTTPSRTSWRAGTCARPRPPCADTRSAGRPHQRRRDWNDQMPPSSRIGTRSLGRSSTATTRPPGSTSSSRASTDSSPSGSPSSPRAPVPGDVLLGRERVAQAQVVKQTDVLLLHHLVPDEVAPDSLIPNLDFYEPRTSHGSSLSPGAHAALLARAGRIDAALETLAMAAYMDLDDRSGKAAGGTPHPDDGRPLAGARHGLRRDPPSGRRAGDRSLAAAQAGRGSRSLVRFRGRRVRVTIADERVVVRRQRRPAPCPSGHGPDHLDRTAARAAPRATTDGVPRRPRPQPRAA